MLSAVVSYERIVAPTCAACSTHCRSDTGEPSTGVGSSLRGQRSRATTKNPLDDVQTQGNEVSNRVDAMFPVLEAAMARVAPISEIEVVRDRPKVLTLHDRWRKALHHVADYALRLCDRVVAKTR